MRTLQIVAVAALVAAPSARIEAQDLFALHRTDFYILLGGGSGNFTFTCDDPACPGGSRNSGDFAFVLGYHIKPRFRLEVTAHNQREGDIGNHLIANSAGAAVYVWRNLHVRGAATWLTPSVGDVTGSYEGKGKGFLAGAGYDLTFGHMFSLTPYVNYGSGSLPTVDRTQLGGATSSTAGKVTQLNFGAGLAFIGGAWECVSSSGQHYRIKRFRPMTYGARSCVNQVEQRLNGRR